jgi:hypothetical protein
LWAEADAIHVLLFPPAPSLVAVQCTEGLNSRAVDAFVGDGNPAAAPHDTDRWSHQHQHRIRHRNLASSSAWSAATGHRTGGGGGARAAGKAPAGTSRGFRSSATARAADYYDTLGISRSADADEIKKAYYKLAKQFHPDANKDDAGAAKKFQEAQKAYEVGVPRNRSTYQVKPFYLSSETVLPIK